MPVWIDLDGAVNGRLPERVDTAAYDTVSEALLRLDLATALTPWPDTARAQAMVRPAAAPARGPSQSGTWPTLSTFELSGRPSRDEPYADSHSIHYPT